MSRTIACEHCQRVLRLDPENLGKTVQCPACGRVQVAGAEPIPIEPTPIVDQFSALPMAPTAPTRAPEDGIAVSLPSPGTPPEAVDVARPIDCPYCEEKMPLSASQCPACQRAVDDASIQDDIRRLDERRRKLNILSFVLGLPGLYLLFMAEVHLCAFLSDPYERLMRTSGPAWLSWPAYLFGPEVGMTVTLVVGLLLTGTGVGLAARYKGRSSAYGLLVILCFLGFFLLPFVVGDKNGRKLERLRRTLLRRAGVDRIWNYQAGSSTSSDDGP
jgi:hypothetical protein